MEKPAQTDVQLLDAIRRRWSPRAFGSRPVSREDTRVLLEAARWAPSAMNNQPWRFIVASIEDEEAHRQLVDVLVPGNQIWAAKAPLLMLTIAQVSYDHAWHDVGLATSQLIIQAVSLGLFAHPMAGYDADKARRVYAIPDDLQPVTAIAIGYPGDPDSLTDTLRERELSERKRKGLTDLVFTRTFGQPWSD